MTGARAWTLAAVLLGGELGVCAADFQFVGSIAGKVRDPQGVPQMGATVVLMNRNDRVVRRAVTNIEGEFQFDSLQPDTYSVKVNLSTFVPARRSGIQVRAGASNLLNIQLANLFSTIELVYTSPGQNSVLSDEWKWALRSNASTRPVLRILPTIDPVWSSSRHPAAFSDTRGLLRVSAGDAGMDLLGTSADLGTAFALATSLFGSNELRFSGNLGYASESGTPATGFRAGFSRKDSSGLTPDVELTVRQLSARAVAGAGMLGHPGAMPELRTMSLKLADRRQLTEEASIEYGTMMETVVFLNRLNVLSPFARLNYDLGEYGMLNVAYSSGAPAVDLMDTGQNGLIDSTLTSGLAGLGVFPRVSLRGGQARVQRSTTYEAGYQKKWGRRSLRASMYRDELRDSAFLMGGATSGLSSSEVLPDLGSSASVFNAGNLRATGYAVTLTEEIVRDWLVSLGAGSGGALLPRDSGTAASAEELRRNLDVVQRPWASLRISGVTPKTGTRFVTAYMFVPAGTAAMPHAYLTQGTQQIPGLNVQVRQPLPAIGGMPGRMELAAELRNLLAQGYVPVAGPDGRSLWLIPFPRTVRGGVSFVF